MINNNYFSINEDLGFDLLKSFNEETNLFKSIERAPEKHYYDVSGKTVNDKDTIIEIKHRNLNIIKNENGEWKISGCSSSNNTFFDDNILLSTDKGLDILFDALVYDKIPLHITICNNGIIIHNLLKLNHRPKRINQIKTVNHGYRAMEKASKQGLYLDSAVIYLNNEGKWEKQ